MEKLDKLCVSGYFDGNSPDAITPNSNNHPAYIHGWRNGRDDFLCSTGKIKFPTRMAAQSRKEWNYIIATCQDCD